MPSKRIAAIDLGTNSFHAIIVDVHSDGRFTSVDSLKEMVTLGKNGVGKKMTKSDFSRGMDALRKIKTLCDHKSVEKIIAFATSAIREAPNGGDFVQMVIDELGFKIQPIPGYKEAELIGHAVMHGMALEDKPALVMDIGGGSTEFVILNKTELLYMVSRKIGVSRLTSDFVKNDPITKSEIDDITKLYKKELNMLAGQVDIHSPEILIGSSGTMQNIASMIAQHKGLSLNITLNEFEYSKEDFLSFYKEFMKLNRKKRIGTPGLDEKRVDFILPGLVLVKYVLEKFEITRVKTSVRAMREGIIVEYVKHNVKGLKLLDTYPNTRERSVYELLKKYDWPKKHSRHVATMALKLFDDLQKYHGLGRIDRELLHFAALMHDIGYYISNRKHHKHSLYIILNSNLKGFTQEEIEIMGHVARYHRRSIPRKRHILFISLSQGQQDRIRKLSGLLRLADGLDRSHYQNVISFHTKDNDVLRISIVTMGDPELEIWGAMRKREMVESMIGKPVEVVSTRKK